MVGQGSEIGDAIQHLLLAKASVLLQLDRPMGLELRFFQQMLGRPWAALLANKNAGPGGRRGKNKMRGGKCEFELAKLDQQSVRNRHHVNLCVYAWRFWPGSM